MSPVKFQSFSFCPNLSMLLAIELCLAAEHL